MQNIALATRLARDIRHRKVTIRATASALGVSRCAVENWIHGRNGMCRRNIRDLRKFLRDREQTRAAFTPPTEVNGGEVLVMVPMAVSSAMLAHLLKGGISRVK